MSAEQSSIVRCNPPVDAAPPRPDREPPAEARLLVAARVAPVVDSQAAWTQYRGDARRLGR